MADEWESDSCSDFSIQSVQFNDEDDLFTEAEDAVDVLRHPGVGNMIVSATVLERGGQLWGGVGHGRGIFRKTQLGL